MTDFTRQASGITSPAFGAAAITPSNDTDFTDIVPAFDHIHFHFDAELQEAADRWYTAIATALGW